MSFSFRLSALGLPLRVALGYAVTTPTMGLGERESGIILFLILPLIRFLKLLRYFAARKPIEIERRT